MAIKQPAMLIILDGWGLVPIETGNAPLLAKTPVLDYIYATYPKTSIAASGLEVGLNPGEPGNSEVGHLNLGSGRVVWESLPLINQAIESKSFFKNEAFLAAVEHAKKNKSKLHLWGLVSDGGVHSHLNHLLALLDLCAKQRFRDVVIHFVADGRDTAPEQADIFLAQLEEGIKRTGLGRIATLIGRYYAMDRDKNWDRVKTAYDLLTQNSGQKLNTVQEAIGAAYAAKKSDEFIGPMVIGEGGVIADNDALIMFNFRSDRARQLYDALTLANPTFSHTAPKNLFVCTMTEYRKGQTASIAFTKINLVQTLADLLAAKSLNQYHLAETEKYAHVTYFFNGGTEKPHPGEKQVIVPSKKVATYDQAPAMSAPEISQKLIEAVSGKLDFIVVNFANGDMVGHTGDLKAAIEACQVVDQCLSGVLKAASVAGYRVILTADHGNCETMIDETTGKPHKEHTNNPVPFVHLDLTKMPFAPADIVYAKSEYQEYASGTPVGILADVAPSLLAILGIDKPEQMAGMDLTVAL